MIHLYSERNYHITTEKDKIFFILLLIYFPSQVVIFAVEKEKKMKTPVSNLRHTARSKNV